MEYVDSPQSADVPRMRLSLRFPLPVAEYIVAPERIVDAQPSPSASVIYSGRFGFIVPPVAIATVPPLKTTDPTARTPPAFIVTAAPELSVSAAVFVVESSLLLA